MDLDNDIYEAYDHLQREKSTGSGLVLAVPAIILDTKVDKSDDDDGKPTVVTDGGEYENLATDNQYYEQVEFGNHAKNKVVMQPSFEDSLYSIPQAISSNNSTTGLTSKTTKSLCLQSLDRRWKSVMETFTRNKKQKSVKHKEKTIEDMYSKPKKFSLTVVPDTNPSLVLLNSKTMTMISKHHEDDNKSYMSVHVQSNTKDTHKKLRDNNVEYFCSPCDMVKLKKYLVMSLLVLCLMSLLSVGLYFMSGNVVTVTPDNSLHNTLHRQRSFIYDSKSSVDRSSTWKDFNQINWGTTSTKLRTTTKSSASSSSRRLSVSSDGSWTSWSSWSQCAKNPCIKGETIARSRRCVDSQGDDTDMKICIQQGGVNVEMEPCFCF